MNCIKPCDKQRWLLTAEKKGEQREKEKKNKIKTRKEKSREKNWRSECTKKRTQISRYIDKK